MTESPSEPPVGVVGLLFTDIEGSTALAARLGSKWQQLLAAHHRIVGDAIAAEGGHVDGTEGDAFFAVFTDPAAAARAALAAQRGLAGHDWPSEADRVKVRMGLHVGYVERSATGYVGLEIHRAARVAAAAHGGQLLLTAAAREVAGTAVATDFLGAHRLKDFPAPVHLYCANIDGRGAAAFPPPRTSDARPTNLPAGLPALVGRDDERQRLRDALLRERERLVTLTGRGGAGKTSLALNSGAELLDEYPGGVWWVDLTRIDTAERVLPAIAATVGAERDLGADPSEAVISRLADAGTALVVLDNMEHVLEARQVVEELLAALPELRILVTTQVPLRLAAERVIPLDALNDGAALALIERVARRRGVRWDDSESARQALVEIAHLLDGLPLALELAAARLAILGPAQLRDRLRSSLDLLKDPSRPDRQQSLVATLEWTLGLLDPVAQELFIRLAVFAGPVELDELEIVAGSDGLDVLEGLSALLDVALVRRIESGDGRIRFGLPEALRQIAAQRLDAAPDADRWRRAHAELQDQRLRVSPFCTQAQEAAAVAALPESFVALKWAQSRDRELADSLSVWLAAWLFARGRLRESVEILAPLLEAPPRDPDLQAHVASHHGGNLTVAGQHDEALRWTERAIQLAASERTAVEVLLGRALARSFAGDTEGAVADNREATKRARSLDPILLAIALIFEAQALIAADQLDEARDALREAREVGERSGAVSVRFVDTQEGDLAMAEGRPEQALEPYARSLEAAQTRGDALQVLFDLRGMANALGSLERDAEAVEVVGLAEAHAAEIGGDASIGSHLQGDEPVRLALERLGEQRSRACRARGREVAGGLRVARACQLGRAAAPAGLAGWPR